MFGLHGLTGLVPWFWSSAVLMVDVLRAAADAIAFAAT
jgi:hypothetical protein